MTVPGPAVRKHQPAHARLRRSLLLANRKAGGATTTTQGSTLTINQKTNNDIINWNTFNIGAGETVNINMPGSTSVELDLVTGGLGPSQIYGSLSANGIVYLVNPNGILVGSGSSANA
jgi:filamentous hemagglutinin family protein